ncbi:unnamed protein product [Discula destructiva]
MPPRKNPSSKTKASTSQSKDTPSRKRKAPTDQEQQDEKPAKRSRDSRQSNAESRNLKQTETSPETADKLEQPVVVNRAPVLELWGACVAHLVHPDLSWNLCLSIGSSISAITAIAKGRSIETIAPPENSKDSKKKPGENLPTIEVMGFPMTIKGDSVMVKGKPKTTREASLQRKFGAHGYTKVKATMDDALQSWQGHEEQLDGAAFHMYEKFRPDVAKGTERLGAEGRIAFVQN